MNLRALVEELKRRRVVRVVGVYVVLSFGVLQAAELMLPRLGVPDLFVTFLVVLALLGLPVVVGLAWALDVTPAGIRRADVTADAATHAPLARPASHVMPRAAFAVLVLVSLSAAAWLALSHGDDDAASLDSQLLAIMPFRVQGADASLAYLHEGMVDLLAAKLADAPRAVDVRAVISAYRRMVSGGEATAEQAGQVARRLGAARFVMGSVVGAPSGVTLRVTLYDTGSGRELSHASEAGAADSLDVVVDRLVARLLSRELREAEHRLAYLTSTSFPAVRTYLEAKSLYRRGRYDEAAQRFSAALDVDSSFALAGLGLAESAGMLYYGAGSGARGTRSAWAFRDRLSPADQAYLSARVGAHYPRPHTLRESLDVWERLTREQPDRAEAWYEYGDRLFHFGAYVGMTDQFERADASFRRALELDPGFFPALQHMTWSALVRGDFDTAHRFAADYLAQDSVGFSADFIRWILPLFARDSAAMMPLVENVGDINHDLLIAFSGPQLFGLLPDHDASIAHIRATARRHARGAAEIAHIERAEHADALNTGRPARAAQAMETVLRSYGHDATDLVNVIRAALYWDGDRPQAERAVSHLSTKLGSAVEAHADAATVQQWCMLAQWHLWHGQMTVTRAVAARLHARAGAPPYDDAGWHAHVCGLLLDAGAAATTSTPDARDRVIALDSLMLVGPPIGEPNRITTNVVTARLLELIGDRERALAAIRRHGFAIGHETLMSTRLRETGRLAEAAGDRDLAMAAYTEYLQWRIAPETAVAQHDDAVRNALARLNSERIR